MPALQNWTWPDAFRVLASVLPNAPSILVLGELPWLAEQDALVDGAPQTGWDRLLASRPVLLLLLGSDVHMMERLTAYDRPFYGRADTMVLGPLNPADLSDALGAADAIDAHLVTGGLPGIVRTWPHGTPALEFLEEECADPAAALSGVPAAALDLVARARRRAAGEARFGARGPALSGVQARDGVDLVWTPEDVVAAWRS